MIFLLLVLLTTLGLLLVKGMDKAMADWWQRPEVRPTQPSYERNLPTPIPTNTPIPTSFQQPTATVTPRIGEPTGIVSPTPTASSGRSTTTTSNQSTSEDDPCAPGKPYIGPYCGWSPKVGGENKAVNENLTRIGGPEVKGLSYTSGEELTFSDIMLLAGILSLLLYLRSKWSKKAII